MDIKYTIPENKQDRTITHYIKINELFKRAEEDEVEVNDNQILSIFLELPLHIIDKMPISDYNFALEKVTELLNQKSSFVSRFKYKGIEFGFIPDLEEITAGEYAALDTFFKDSTKHALDIINVLYRPILEEKTYKNWWSKEEIKKYTIKDYDSDVDVQFFKDVPYEIFEGAIVFFYTLETHLLSATQKYIKAMEKQQNSRNHSVKNGDGFKHLTHTLKQRIQTLTKYTKSLQVKYYLD
jgi:hypothetical protein